MSLLKFINDEPTTLAEICMVKPKPIRIGETINEDIVFEIHTELCTFCELQSDGYGCTLEFCPYVKS